MCHHVYPHVPPCTNVPYHHVPPCTIMYQCAVPSCTTMYHHIPMYHHVPPCTIMYHHVPCAILCCALPCTIMYHHVPCYHVPNSIAPHPHHTGTEQAQAPMRTPPHLCVHQLPAPPHPVQTPMRTATRHGMVGYRRSNRMRHGGLQPIGFWHGGLQPIGFRHIQGFGMVGCSL